MSSYTSSPAPVENPQSSSLSQSFSPWVLRQSWSLTAQISAAVAFLLYLAEIAYYSPYLSKNSGPLFDGNRFPVIIDILHIVVISGFIVTTIRLLDHNKRESERIKFISWQIYRGTPFAILKTKDKKIDGDKSAAQKEGRENSKAKQAEAAAEYEKAKKKEEEGEYEEKLEVCYNRLKRFKKNFLWFWIGMLCLYIVLGCNHAFSLYDTEKAGHQEQKQTTEEKIDEHVQKIIYLIQEIIDPSKNPPEKKEEEFQWPPPSSVLSAGKIAKHAVFPAVSFLVNTLTMMPIFTCFLVMYFVSDNEEKDKLEIKKLRRSFIKYIGLFCLAYAVCLAAVLSFNSDAFFDESKNLVRNFHAVFFALSGILNALIFALLITRLDSKLLGLRSWLIGILYSYAAIQPLFAVFEFNSPVMFQIMTAVLALAFILKVYFFLIIMYAVQTGKMLNYFFCFPTLSRLTTYSRLFSRHRHTPLSPEHWVRITAFKKLINITSRLFGPFRIRILLEYIFRFSGRFRISVTVGIVTTVAFVAVLLYPQFLSVYFYFYGPLFYPSTPVHDFLGKIIAGSASIAHVILIGLMIIWLQCDRLHYRKISRNLPNKANNDPRVIENSDMRIELVKKIAFYLFKTEVSHDILEDCITQIRRFNNRFMIFWGLTIGLHAALATGHLMEAFRGPLESGVRLPLSATTFILSALNLLALFHCFLLLDSPPTEDKNNLSPGFLRIEQNKWLKGLRQSLGYSNLAAGLFIGLAIFGFIMSGSHNQDQEYQKGFITLLTGLTGTMGGLAIALVIARMSSRWFGLNLRITNVLLLYAAIQPLSLFIYFAKSDSMTIAVLVAALGFKIPFFLVIRTCLRKGPLLNYFICLPLLRDRVNKIIENHFEVTLTPTEHGKYRLNILKNGKLQFTAREEFSTKTKCDRFIKDFTKELKDLKKRQDDKREPESIEEIKNTNFRPGEKLGAFWLELVEKESPDDKVGAFRCMWCEKESDENVVLLESVTLRSEEQVLELRQQAIDMIPYCRYNR